MIAIKKEAEPAGLKELREEAADRGLSPKEAYQTLVDPLKRKVRKSLVREQGQLCAYCMCRIPRTDVAPRIAPIIIEHIVPRNPFDGRDVGQGLDYQNLLAVCHGNQGPSGTRQLIDLTCDAHRKNTEFRKINPCDASTLKSITYHLDGKIDAKDPDIRFDLLHTLNLNCSSAPLVAERKAALDALLMDLGNLPEQDMLDYCNLRLTVLEQEENPKTPYVGILLWYLRTMLTALSG